MGLVRIILAISVFLGHSWPLFPPKAHEMTGGVVSVRLFYIISGYLIAMVLNEKYGSFKNFYLSRALRLLPTYLIILAVTFFLSCLFFLWKDDPFLLGYLIGYKDMLSIFDIAMISIPQLGILFLDLFGFIGVNENGIHPILVSWGNKNGYEFLLVPQAWTLGIECWFYLFAPVLLLRAWGPYVLFLASFSCSLLIVWLLPSEISINDPWARRFFPSELQYFAMGCIAYRFRDKLLPNQKSVQIILYILCLFCLITMDGWEFFLPSMLIYLSFSLTIPAILSLSKFIPFDRLIGDTSYPFYLCHWLFLHLVSNEYLPHFGFPIWSSMLYTLSFSVLLVLFVENKVNRKRKVLT